MSRDRSTIKNSRTGRRIVAVLCIVCIAVLQCFVVMPALSDGVHAAGDVSFRAEYSTGFSVAQDNKSWITGATKKKIEIKDEEGNTVGEENGYLLSSILKKANLNNNDGVNVGIIPVSDPSKAYLVEIDDTWKLYDNGSLYGDPIGEIEAYLNREPIKITKVSKNKEKPYKGEKVTISYKMEVDDFFESTDEYKDNRERILELEWVASNNNVSPASTTTNDTVGSFEVTVKGTGSVDINPEATDSDFSYLNDGSHKISLTGKKTSLKVKPTKVSLKVGDTKTCSVTYNGKSVSNSKCKWSSNNTSIATVSGGTIKAVKEGKTSIKVKYKEKTATVTVTVEKKEKESEAKPSSTRSTSNKYTTRKYTGYTYRPYRPTTRPGVTTRTGLTVTTTATRPTQTGSTATPSFQTMKVKEVYLTETIPEEPQYYDENGNPIDEEEFLEGEEGVEEDYDEDGVSFPAAAGSAAVAVAACGAGAVGRVRRFNLDIGKAAAAAVTGKAADGGRKRFGKKTTEGTADQAGAKTQNEDKSRNPLKKFRKK